MFRLILFLLLSLSAFAQTSPFLPEDLYNKLNNELSGDIAYDHLRTLTQFHVPNGATGDFMKEANWIAAMAKPYNLPVIPHGSSVYNYHFVMANTNSPYAEYLSVGKGTEIQPIFSVLEGEPLPEKGRITLDPNKAGFGVELKRELLAPFPP